MLVKKAIVFDLYGTLLDIHTDEEQELLWRRLSYFYASLGAYYEIEELQATYHELVEDELGRITNVDHPDFEILRVFDRLFRRKDVHVTDEKVLETATLFRLLSLEYVRPYPDALCLLEYLKEQNFKLILLSNAQQAFTLNEMKSTGIYEYFDNIYISSDYETCKPDETFFNAMLDGEQLKVEDCLFVGNDHRTDIEGANKIGMDSIYIHTNCSPYEVPDQIPALFRVESGRLEDLIRVFKNNVLHQL